jgi:ketosteroid isomerase-like protein
VGGAETRVPCDAPRSVCPVTCCEICINPILPEGVEQNGPRMRSHLSAPKYADHGKDSSLKNPFSFHALCILATVLVAPLAQVSAQTPPKPEELFRTIQALDTKLFDAYNRCDLVTFGSMVAEDLEFYHDIGGLSRSRQASVDALKNNICGKVTRELVPGTLEVHPIANYGALEIGVHRFRHPGRDHIEPVGEARFIHLWRKTGSGWELARVISYDHHSVKK